MPLWQIALIGLVIAWALQAIGTYFQMRHYRSVMGDVSQRWADGVVGAGAARSTLGKGVILLLVVSPDRVVRRLSVMRGRSVFAKFKTMSAFEGRSLEVLRADPPFADKGALKAFETALTQVDKVFAASKAGKTEAVTA